MTFAPYASGRSVVIPLRAGLGSTAHVNYREFTESPKAKAMRVIRERGNVTCQEILKILGLFGQKKRSLRDSMAKGSKNTKSCGKRKAVIYSPW